MVAGGFHDRGEPLCLLCLQSTCATRVLHVLVVAVPGELDGNGGLPGPGGVPLLRAPAVFADSLACLKNCVSFTLGPVRPTDEQFHKYLPWFLSDPPNIKCPKG